MGRSNFDLTHNFARTVAAAFLRNIRRGVVRRSLNEDRLPGWLKAARVRVGWINDSIVFVYEDASEDDTYEARGSVGADTVVLLSIDDFRPLRMGLQAGEVSYLKPMVGAYGPGKLAVLVLRSERPTFFDCGYAGYHGPRALLNIFIEHSPIDPTAPVAMRFIPFALWVHAADAANQIDLWHRCEEHLMRILASIHNSEMGTFYENLRGRAKPLPSIKKPA
jgi:hypothetical protein